MSNIVTVLSVLSALSSLSSILGCLVPDSCPITQNNYYPACTASLLGGYDFIIVGAGTAGCVLANRLSENPLVNVLLLEHGADPSRASEIPLDFILLQQTAEDWAFKQDQPGFFLGQGWQQNLFPQGHAVGGGSAINAMIYSSGFPADYDLWGYLTQDSSWSWNKMKNYFSKLDRMVHTSNYTELLAAARKQLALAAIEMNMSVNNASDMFGYKDHPLTIDNHTRYSIAKAYLKPIQMSRPNLCLMTKKRVNKIIIENQVAVGVEVQDLDDMTSPPFIIETKREIIVSAGAINSPKLLMLSGIGPKEHLEELGIPLIQDLPVGKALEDHVIVPFFIKMKDIPMPCYQLLRTAFCTTGEGLDNIQLANFLCFNNTRGKLDKPDIEYLHFEFLQKDPVFLEAYLAKFGILEEFGEQLRQANSLSALLLTFTILLHPISSGQVLLNSIDPLIPPKILPNYLQADEDVQVLLASINQFIKPLLKTVAFLGCELFKFNMPKCDRYAYQSDAYWKCYFTHFAGTIYHPCGTCKMGTDNSNSVVNSRLKVRGIQGLRVVDSSVMPEIISGHLNIPTGGLAENAADLIKADNGI